MRKNNNKCDICKVNLPDKSRDDSFHLQCAYKGERWDNAHINNQIEGILDPELENL